MGCRTLSHLDFDLFLSQQSKPKGLGLRLPIRVHWDTPLDSPWKDYEMRKESEKKRATPGLFDARAK